VRVEGTLRVAVICIAIALVVMLVTLVWPTPHTIGLFLGPGLGFAALGFAAFGLRVIRDLRARRLL
jgi:hypothetical protein